MKRYTNLASLLPLLSPPAVLFLPGAPRESFTSDTDCGGHDGETRSLRYLEWSLKAKAPQTPAPDHSDRRSRKPIRSRLS